MDALLFEEMAREFEAMVKAVPTEALEAMAKSRTPSLQLVTVGGPATGSVIGSMFPGGATVVERNDYGDIGSATVVPRRGGWKAYDIPCVPRAVSFIYLWHPSWVCSCQQTGVHLPSECPERRDAVLVVGVRRGCPALAHTWAGRWLEGEQSGPLSDHLTAVMR